MTRQHRISALSTAALISVAVYIAPEDLLASYVMAIAAGKLVAAIIF